MKTRTRGANAASKGGTTTKKSAEIGGYRFSEATILLDQAPRSAQIIVAPNGDTLVVPTSYGTFSDMAVPKEFTPGTSGDDEAQDYHDMSAAWDAGDAADILGDLIRLKKGEADEPDQTGMLDASITGVLNFIRSETAEIGQPPEPGEDCDLCSHPVACDCTICDCAGHTAVAEAVAFLKDPLNADLTDSVKQAIREAGKRNAAADQRRIQQAHDLLHDAGAAHEPGKTYAGMKEADVEHVGMAEVRFETTAQPENVTFRESAGDGWAMPIALREAQPLFDDASRTVTITPIRPGWGNRRDNNYYPASALREAVQSGKFNGTKMYKDHPRKSDEKELPERSVKDWFATTGEAFWHESAGVPRLPVKVHDPLVYQQWKDAPEQVAFSVLGAGAARPGTVDGRSGRIVEAIGAINSTDWVTEAGAGGAIAFAESAATEETEMDIKSLTAEQLREANPALYAELMGKAPEPPATPKTDDAAPGWFTAEMAKVNGRLDTMDGRITEATAASRIAEAKKVAKPIVNDEIGKSTLPAGAKAAIIATFSEAAVGDGQQYGSEDTLRNAVQAQVSLAEQLLGPAAGRNRVTGLGPTASTEGDPIREATIKSIGQRWGAEALPAKPKLAWTPEEVLAGGGNSQPFTVAESADDDDAGVALASSASEAAAARIAAAVGR